MDITSPRMKSMTLYQMNLATENDMPIYLKSCPFGGKVLEVVHSTQYLLVATWH